MFDFQSHMIFPVSAVPAAGPWPQGAEHLVVKTPDAFTLSGIHIPAEPDGRTKPSSTLILGFGGNAWNAQDVAEYLHELFPENSVVAFHYRGYRPSEGSASAEALTADAPLIYDAVVAKLKPKKVVCVGFSIGTGVAAQLTTQRQPAGLILVTPFDSLKSVAQDMVPWLPIGPFFGHEINAAEPLSKSEIPVAIVAGERDEIVAPERTSALRKKVSNLVFDRTISRAGHNDIYARSDFHEAMREALKAVGG